MWIVIKFDINKINSLTYDLKKKLGDDVNLFMPKIKIQKLRNYKIFSKELNLLGNYIFCYHPKFKNTSILNSLKYLRGLKYILKEFLSSQNDINDFIVKCKNHENKEGYIKQSFFDINKKNDLKFLSGPFTNLIFQVVTEQKSSLDILLGNFKTTVSKDKYLFRAV